MDSEDDMYDSHDGEYLDDYEEEDYLEEIDEYEGVLEDSGEDGGVSDYNGEDGGVLDENGEDVGVSDDNGEDVGVLEDSEEDLGVSESDKELDVSDYNDEDGVVLEEIDYNGENGGVPDYNGEDGGVLDDNGEPVGVSDGKGEDVGDVSDYNDAYRDVSDEGGEDEDEGDYGFVGSAADDLVDPDLSSCHPQDTYTLEFDGASKRNPGKAGAGAVLRNPDGSVAQKIMKGVGVATNNVAEYEALIQGLKYAQSQGIDRIRVKGDSNLVCKQINGDWKTRSKNLTDLNMEAKDLKSCFKEFHIDHIPRASNSEADALANDAVNVPDGKWVTR